MNIPAILPVRVYQPDEGRYAPLSKKPTWIESQGTPTRQFIQKWETGYQIRWQFEYEGTIQLAASGNGVTEIVDVTPSGWNGEKSWAVNFTPTESGCYDFTLTFTDFLGAADFTLKSEKVKVQNEIQNHVLVEWSNSENNNGINYEANYIGQIFYEAVFKETKVEGQIETMKDENGATINLKSEIQIGQTLKVYAAPDWIVQQASLVLSSDRLTINKTNVIFVQPISPKPILGTNLYEFDGDAEIKDWEKGTKAGSDTTVLISSTNQMLTTTTVVSETILITS